MRLSPNVFAAARVARALPDEFPPYCFVGGVAVDLLVDEATLTPVRSTEDVDVAVAITTRAQLEECESMLMHSGFRHDMTSNVICRWLSDRMVVDVMPTEASVGMTSTNGTQPRSRAAVR